MQFFSQVRLLLETSRPRFWMYTLGPALLGLAASISPERSLWEMLKNNFISLTVIFAFFALPGNFLVYGINDLADEETDRTNPKKGDKEVLLTHVQRKIVRLFFFSVIALALMMGIFLLTTAWSLFAIFVSWVMAAVAYSAPPARFKARPFIDAYSNFFYWLPGLLIYHLLTGGWFSIPVMIAATAWTTAMHAFSAIPDIHSDARAGIKTTAVVLGEQKTLLFCAFHWSISTLIVLYTSTIPLAVLTLIYVPLVLIPLFDTSVKVSRLYWLFPTINASIGFIAWVLLALT